MAINDDNDDWDPADIGMFAGFKVLNTHDFKDDFKNHKPANNGPYQPYGPMRKICIRCGIEIGFIGDRWMYRLNKGWIKVTRHTPTCNQVNMNNALE